MNLLILWVHYYSWYATFCRFHGSYGTTKWKQGWFVSVI